MRMVINDLATAIIYLLVGVSVLLVGMKMMSGGLKKCIGQGLRRFFKKTENNPFVSLGIGTVVTAGIQSSDATNAMVIGFIDAGAMTLFQGLCIMLGAYIGTTVTGILASFSSLPISLYLLLFAFVGVVMMFFKKDIIKNIGEILTGLGLLFFGLAVMKAGFQYCEIANGIKSVFASINFGPLLYLIGILLAALVQSSSAVTSIVIAMVGAASISLGTGLYIVLGAMVGTVINTLLATIGGTVRGKRAGLIAFCLRLFTTLVMLIFLSLFNNEISLAMHVFAINGNDELPVALFTVFFNIVFMPLCIPLLKPSIKLFDKVIKDKEVDKLKSSIHFIDDKFLNTPAIAELQVKKEILNMYDLSYRNYLNGINKFLINEVDHDEELKELEDQIDFLNNRITDYLIKLSPKVNEKDEKRVGAFFHVINDIERIGDHAYNFFEMYIDMKSKDLTFSEEAIEEIKQFNEVLLKMFDLARNIFNNKAKGLLKDLHELETSTDELKVKFSTNHYNRIKKEKCNFDLSPFYSNILVELERIADHLNNIGYSIVNPTGDDL